jgi:Fe-S-cluster-containing dehydrogenase component
MRDWKHHDIAADELDAFAQERRRMLKLMAAAAAMAGGACSGPPAEKIVPYVDTPEQSLPGKPLFYATATRLSGYGMGVLVEANEGRPTKVEGNPLHPASLGSTDVFAQAAILQLWDPARSQTALRNGQVTTWQEFLLDIDRARNKLDASRGDGLFLLTGTVSSPTLQWQIDALRARYPKMRWHQYDPLHRDNELRGSELAFGRVVDTRYRFDQARVVLSLNADVLTAAPYSVRYARDLAALRNPDRGPMSRIYALETFPTLLGARADHRIALAPADIERFALHLAHELGIGPPIDGSSPAPMLEQALLADLRDAQGAALIVAGSAMPPRVHALAHAMNHRLGGQARTFEHTLPVAFEPVANAESIRALSEAMAAGHVQHLLILDGNPVYDAPADLEFATHLRAVPESIHLSAYVDETSSHCRWHVPRVHEFEQWSDVRAFDGTASIVQPIIAPLYGGRSVHDVLNALLDSPASAHETVRAVWRQTLGDDDDRWRTALRYGAIADTRAPAISLAPRLPADSWAPAPSRPPLTVSFIADQSVRDGEFANNAWLQELPRSMSKLTWDNAAYVSQSTATRLNIATGDEIELRRAGRAVRAGVWVLPNHADDCITLPLGYGRTRAGPVGDGVGFDAYRLRTVEAPWTGSVELLRTGAQRLLVATQQHALTEGRKLTQRGEEIPEHTLYPPHPYDGYKWGMVIDLNACIGCNACTIACQAENNIPVVGKQQVLRGREMHWIRVDRYYRDADIDFQPVPCMHCEHAPCEEVCPVGATVHDSQGLNVQIYNRCVGTRFCSNNCPYKVRRFNFLQYTDRESEALKASRNPEVTVRERGVMEKCSYCIQRIQRGRITAEQLGRRLRDGEVVTACQAACPTQAIAFGDLNDPESGVSRAKASPRNYALLAELNTRPRTTYLERVANRKPQDEET